MLSFLRMKHLIWYLLAGTRGGESRGRILQFLKKRPANANQVATALQLDYKTIRHHLRVLKKNNFISAINKGNYNTAYAWSPVLELQQALFDDIWKRFGRDLGKST